VCRLEDGRRTRLEAGELSSSTCLYVRYTSSTPCSQRAERGPTVECTVPGTGTFFDEFRVAVPCVQSVPSTASQSWMTDRLASLPVFEFYVVRASLNKRRNN
jgi:hypothetical protein